MPESYRELYVKPAATNASNINGGSSEARLFRRTNGSWNSSTRVFTATGDTLDPAWVGQLACVCSDGTTTGAYFAEVTAIDNTAKTITLSSTRTLGTAPTTSATARTITVGGAWTGMSGATTFPFSIATWAAVTNAAGDRIRFNICGEFSVTVSINHTTPGSVVEGYSSSPGDGGLAIMDYTGASTASVLQIGTTAGVYEIRSLWLKDNSTTASPGSVYALMIQTASGVGHAVVSDCVIGPSVGVGVLVNSGTSINTVSLNRCEIYNCSMGGVPSFGVSITGEAWYHIRDCIFHDMHSSCPSALSVASGNGSVDSCVFASNPVAFDDAQSISPRNCVFYNNATAFKITPGISRFGVHAIGCVFENNTTAISRGNTTADRQPIFEQCVFYNNTTKLDSNADGRVFLVNCIDATRSTMFDPANGDFRTKESNLRNAIDGSLLQSSGSYTAFTTRRRDIGIGPSNPYYNGQ